MEIWSFSSLTGNRINWSGWNLAWKRIPCAKFGPDWWRGNYRSPHKFNILPNHSFCPQGQQYMPTEVKFGMVQYFFGLLSHANFSNDQQRGLDAGAPTFCHGCFYPAGAIIYTDWCKIWHGSGWLFHAKFHLNLCKGMGMWVRPRPEIRNLVVLLIYCSCTWSHVALLIAVVWRTVCSLRVRLVL